MAKVTSGSFNTTGYNGRYLTFSWTATQSIDKNQSTISWSLDGAGDAPVGYYKAGAFKVVIAGETVYSSATRINLTKGYHVAGGTKVITHNNDGTMSFTASAEAGIYTTAVNCTGKATFELKDIPRKATITSAPDFNNSSTELTINISNPLGTKAATAISIGTDANNALFDFETFTGNSYKFKLDAAKINTLLSNTPKNSRSVTFVLRTIVNGTFYWHTVNKTFSVVNGAPTLNPVVADEHPQAQVLTGNIDKIISGYNTVGAEVNATALTGATITAVSVTCGGITKKENSNIFNDVTSGKFVVSATDSRGNTNSKTVDKTLIPYFKPTINLVKNNVSTNGEYNIEISGKFFNGSFGAVNNTITVFYKWNNGTETPITATANGNEYRATLTLTGLDYRESYTIEAKVVDKINSIPTEVITVTSIPVFAWDNESFEHYTDVTINGNLSFGETPLADYIIEQGSSGIWAYRKYKSGLVECWGNVSVSTSINTAWGSMYIGATKMSRQSYPFTFKAKPKEYVTAHTIDGACWVYAESGGTGANTTSASGIYNVCRPTSIASQTITFNLYVVGTV